jgi:hypothetical protein
MMVEYLRRDVTRQKPGDCRMHTTSGRADLGCCIFRALVFVCLEEWYLDKRRSFVIYTHVNEERKTLVDLESAAARGQYNKC